MDRNLAPIFGLVRRYYARDLVKVGPRDWPMVSAYSDNPAVSADPALAGAIERIAHAPTPDAERFEYEFNRLFVGPGRVPAAPFETVYRSPERTLMREVTMAVRAAYRERGMETDAKNVQPDDHAAYECAFVAFLLERDEEGDAEALDAFCADHLQRWVPQHVACVRAETGNELCLGFADLIEAALAALASPGTRHERGGE